MAKLTGPLLSMRARGTIGKNIVYADWRGIPYARQHVLPANPDTAGQKLTRQPFSWLNDVYRRLSATAINPWESYASGRPFTGRNGFIKQNLPNLREEIDLLTYIASPGTLGGPALSDFEAATGAVANQVEITCTVGTLPPGWVLGALVAFAILDQDPHAALVADLKEDANAGPSGTPITLTMAAAAESYLCCGWAVYTRDDGQAAYSPSASALATSHA